MGEALTLKFGVAEELTVRASVVVAVRLPEVPVMVTVDVPVVAVALAVRVSTLVPVVGFVPNAAVTPLGRPDAASVTLPVNPPTSVTVIVLRAAAPPCVNRQTARRIRKREARRRRPGQGVDQAGRVRAAPAGAQIVAGNSRIGTTTTAGYVVEKGAVA